MHVHVQPRRAHRESLVLYSRLLLRSSRLAAVCCADRAAPSRRYHYSKTARRTLARETERLALRQNDRTLSSKTQSVLVVVSPVAPFILINAIIRPKLASNIAHSSSSSAGLGDGARRAFLRPLWVARFTGRHGSNPPLPARFVTERWLPVLRLPFVPHFAFLGVLGPSSPSLPPMSPSFIVSAVVLTSVLLPLLLLLTATSCEIFTHSSSMFHQPWPPRRPNAMSKVCSQVALCCMECCERRGSGSITLQTRIMLSQGRCRCRRCASCTTVRDLALEIDK